jgi:hypothetical protein
MSAPRRPFEMVLEIGADSLEDLASALHSIQFDVFEMIERGHQNPHVCTSGSPSSGWNYSLVRTETADHDEYFKKLDAWLEERKAERAADALAKGGAEAQG